MSSFDERENAFENKFAHEEKLDFNIEARCSKLFGLWVAEQLGLNGADAKTYASQMVEENLKEVGFEDILRKARTDLEAQNIDISAHRLEVELDKALKEAKHQVLEEGK